MKCFFMFFFCITFWVICSSLLNILWTPNWNLGMIISTNFAVLGTEVGKEGSSLPWILLKGTNFSAQLSAMMGLPEIVNLSFSYIFLYPALILGFMTFVQGNYKMLIIKKVLLTGFLTRRDMTQ